MPTIKDQFQEKMWVWVLLKMVFFQIIKWNARYVGYIPTSVPGSQQNQNPINQYNPAISTTANPACQAPLSRGPNYIIETVSVYLNVAQIKDCQLIRIESMTVPIFLH